MIIFFYFHNFIILQTIVKSTTRKVGHNLPSQENLYPDVDYFGLLIMMNGLIKK